MPPGWGCAAPFFGFLLFDPFKIQRVSFFILLQIHKLHLCTAELLAALLDVPGTPSASGHVWASASPSNGNIRARLRAVWEEHFGVSQTSTGRHSTETLLQELKSAEAPPPTASVPLRQVLLPPPNAVCVLRFLSVFGSIQ